MDPNYLKQLPPSKALLSILLTQLKDQPSVIFQVMKEWILKLGRILQMNLIR